jgi:hypothetical protein
VCAKNDHNATTNQVCREWSSTATCGGAVEFHNGLSRQANVPNPQGAYEFVHWLHSPATNDVFLPKVGPIAKQ